MECPKLYAELATFCEGKLTPNLDKQATRQEDKQLAAAFNAQVAKRFRALTASEFLDALSSAQIAMWRSSTNADAAAVWLYATAGLPIDVGSGTPTRKRLNAMDDVAELKPLVATVKQAADVSYPHWQEAKCEREANHGDVAWIRKQAAAKLNDARRNRDG